MRMRTITAIWTFAIVLCAVLALVTARTWLREGKHQNLRPSISLTIDPGTAPGSAFYRTCQPFASTADFTFSMIVFTSASVSVFSKDWNTRRNA